LQHERRDVIAKSNDLVKLIRGRWVSLNKIKISGESQKIDREDPRAGIAYAEEDELGGGGGTSSSFVQAASSDTWNINHKLDSRPSVTTVLLTYSES